MEGISDTRTIPRAIHLVPPELGAFLAGDARIEQAYERLTLSGRRELADWIEGAVTPVERRSRARQAAAMIRGL
ncbi:MAG: YdeI/OmpD-associated family protein [Gemmatimonadota bacterium]